jgi:hypothetical protein
LARTILRSGVAVPNIIVFSLNQLIEGDNPFQYISKYSFMPEGSIKRIPYFLKLY